MCIGMVADKVADLAAGGGGEQDDNGQEKQGFHDAWFRWLIVDRPFGHGAGISDVKRRAGAGQPEEGHIAFE